MLHILFLILKIIGIILAVILGILVLLICVVFFVPVSYQGSAKCDGTIESLCGILKVTWLFRLIQVNAKYENGNLRYSVQIAWKKITGGKSLEKNEKKMEEEPGDKLSPSESVEYQKDEKVVQESEEVQCSVEQKTEERTSISERPEEEAETTDFPVEEPEEKLVEEEQQEKEKTSFIEKIRNKINGFKQKLINLCDKIKCTIKNICDKLKVLLEKKDKVMQFIKDKNHIKAFLKLKKEVFKLLKRLRPKEFAVKAKYGFEDPSLTGKVLAVLSMLYPFTEDHMEVIPDFENKILQGRLMVKGRIYVIYFICTVWNLVWCKHIRLLYKDIRNFKL